MLIDWLAAPDTSTTVLAEVKEGTRADGSKSNL